MMEQVGTSQAEYAKLVHIARGEYPFRVDYGNDVDISSAIHDICRYAHTVHTRIVLARLLAQEGKIQRDVLHTVIACFNDQEKSEHQWDEQTKVEMSIRYTGMGAQFDGITLSHEVHKRWKIMKGTPLDKIFQIRDDLKGDPPFGGELFALNILRIASHLRLITDHQYDELLPWFKLNARGPGGLE